MMTTDWVRLRREHAAAVQRYIDTVRGLSEPRWEQPLAEGKWSPEEVTVHLVLAFEAILRELREGVPMVPRVKWWLRPLLRMIFLPRILAGDKLPRARAPRETRPWERLGDRETTIERLGIRAGEVEREMEMVATADRRRRLTHPYFGALPLHRAIRFSAAHVEHHRKQVAAASASPEAPTGPPAARAR